MSKKILERKIHVLERQLFLEAYAEFERWLKNIGYRPAKYHGENSTTDNNIITSSVETLYGVEHYINDATNMHLYFARERNSHVFYFLHEWNYHSLPHTMEDFKAQILKDTKAKKEAIINQLQSLPI